jgi:predicted transcriptional regulator
MDKEAHITVRIEQSKLKQLQRIAKRKDLSVSWLVRQAVDHVIKEEARAGKDPVQGS